MRIELIDTTLRDGQQSPLLFDTKKYRFNLSEKLKIIDGLVEIGIKFIELFSPIVGEKEKLDIIQIIKHLNQNHTKSDITLVAHCRCNLRDVTQALELGFKGVNLYMGTSDVSIQSNHGKNLEDIIKISKEIVSTIRQNYPNIWIRFSGEDAFRTDIENLYTVYDELSEYVSAFGTPDTVGIATPELVSHRIKKLKKRYPSNHLECHFHNDRGLALINMLESVKAGVRYVDCSIFGLAERSGIVSTTGTLLNLYYEDPTYTEGYNLELCYPLNILMASILKIQVPYNEPVSVTNRTHIAGVHQKALLKDKKVYEAHSLEKFGVSKHQILLGPLSGWNLIYYYLKEFENFELTQEEAKEITVIFKSKSDKITKRNSPEHVLITIAEDYGLGRSVLPKTNNTRLENLDF